MTAAAYVQCPHCPTRTISASRWSSLSHRARARLRGKIGRRILADGTCLACYRELKRQGFVVAPRRIEPLERALSAAARNEPECIDWGGRMDSNGYGRYSAQWAHRLVYEHTVGPIPTGLELDHLCRNTRCVNPTHLEPVTHAENMRRAGAAITHCPQSHEYTPENAYMNDGKRQCRACNRARARVNHAKKRAALMDGAA